jgi:integrase
MQLRVRDGKGAKGRVLPLSEHLLKELENYWRAQRQGKADHDSPWLFLGKKAGQPVRAADPEKSDALVVRQKFIRALDLYVP